MYSFYVWNSIILQVKVHVLGGKYPQKGAILAQIAAIFDWFSADFTTLTSC